MTEVSTFGLDLAKNVFQVHGVDISGETVIRRQPRHRQVLPFFRKQPPCLDCIEACATSHYWARELGVSTKKAPRAPVTAERGEVIRVRRGISTLLADRSGRHIDLDQIGVTKMKNPAAPAPGPPTR